MNTKQRSGRRGRALRTAAQRHELVREWRASGLTQTAFCGRCGIHPTTFSTWCRAAARATPGDGKTKPGVEFAEFKMAVGGMAPVEVELPNGVRIRLREVAACRELLPMLRGEAAC